ncbi:hypothetical protein VE01_02833 [Pseudogymnoascus verrucosus]|uniref:Methyltransferase domain-containing protein n=1 Tax=Pseudogymnoascus verrucosus TaxID=342668 RepID=A0A1B8GV05_9PEZI|nr:uncharacterized protein VE01_02833 [Pseudogymnoascus verrucosus]OBT99630.1 hypothetical protein VE01_02833 [Pseudogymnoascus verrucosus]
MTSTSTVAGWYNANANLEHNRLITNRLEFAISLHIIQQSLSSLPPTTGPKEILDLGGGTGRYAVELAKQGHNVTLVDISQTELEQARLHAQESGVALANITCANALDIRSVQEVFRENYYDLVLCQGPLYHLLSIDERLHVLHSCMTATKRGGFVIAAFVTKYAHLRDLAQREPLRLVMEAGFYAEYLETGQYTRNPRNVGHHTYREEVGALFGTCVGREGEVGVRLEVERMVACESFLGGGLAAGLNGLDEEGFRRWFEVALGAAEDLDVGTGDHLLVVARKVVSEVV